MHERQLKHLPTDHLMKSPAILLSVVFLICFAPFGSSQDSPQESANSDKPESDRYSKVVAPLMQKYCVSCHNADDFEGEFSVENYKAILNGGESGLVLAPGDAKSSRLIRVMIGLEGPKMPPEDQKAPTKKELAQLIEWVDDGAKGPKGSEPIMKNLVVPDVRPLHQKLEPITDVTWSSNGKWIALGKFKKVELRDPQTMRKIADVGEISGKVNRVKFSADGKFLVIASGVTGLYGEALVIETETLKIHRRFEAHRDSIYGIDISHDNSIVATSGYDKAILLWDVASGKQLKSLKGHNGPVNDVHFSSNSKQLVSASSDQTLKVWSVEKGERLDTLGQPLKEQFTAAISPDNNWIAGAGRDNRVRIWSFVSKQSSQINPIRFARFAHEQPIVALRFSPNGKILASASEEQTIKFWNPLRMQNEALIKVAFPIASICFSPDGKELLVSGLNGAIQKISVPKVDSKDAADELAMANPLVIADGEMNQVKEQEPNDNPKNAQPIKIPSTITGIVFNDADNVVDQEFFKFTARKGEQLVVETRADRDKSPLDTRVEVLTESGQPIPRVKLQAVRDSYFTFRGKDSSTSDDFRVHNWEEMELNEFLYANGEVVKLWHYPRGPDSGFQVYPGTGKRWNYFDTTPNSHALQAPCYIVRPMQPEAKVSPNGLPTFTLYYANDDESKRKSGEDSKLLFTAPYDGTFLVRMHDVRGFEGSNYKYKLTVRHRKPDFKIFTDGGNTTVNRGSGKELRFRVERLDDFNGPIKVEVEGLPPGFHLTSPIMIESGQEFARATLNTDADVAALTVENKKSSKIFASAMINGKEVRKPSGTLGELKIADKPNLLVRIGAADATYDEIMKADPNKPLELTVAPGSTVTAKVCIERNGHKQRVQFGNADAGRNMPHGVFVDNIGLNGLMIVPNENERIFFITAAKTATEQTRHIHLRANNVGGQCSWPAILHIKMDAKPQNETASK